MKHLISFAALALFSLSANADIFKPTGTGPIVEKVALPATITSESPAMTLNSIGAGLRDKKVVMVNVKVYVGQLFVSNLEAFKKADSLNSIEQIEGLAIRLHFLRDVDAENVKNSFRDALKANKVDFKSAEINKFLEAVAAGGEAKSGKTLTVFGHKNADGTETIVYESNDKKATSISGSKGFIKNVFSIWLGTPSDSGVKKLKEAILK